MPSLYVVRSSAGPQRDLSRGAREQAGWDEHAAFIDGLVEEGYIVLGGPFPDSGGAMLVVSADNETAVRDRLAADPWYVNGLLTLEDVQRWEIFIDELNS